MNINIDLKTLELDEGTHKIALIATGKNCFNSIPVTIKYEVKAEAAEMHPPTVSVKDRDILVIADNDLNEDRTCLYKIYRITGSTYTYVSSVARTDFTKKFTKEISNLPTDKHYVVTAVDAEGTESPYSDRAFVASCFVEGTPVLMADGSYKEIQNVVVGDLVQSYNIEEAVYCDGVVSEVVTGYTNRIAMILTDNGSYIAMAEPHPLYTKDGFHSITNKDGYPTLVVGDILVTAFGETTIIDITVVDTEPTIVYSLGVIPLYGGGSVGLLSQSVSSPNTQLMDSILQDTTLQEHLPTAVQPMIKGLYFAGHLAAAAHNGGSND